MADNNKNQIETGINTAMYMDDVELAKRLLENADQNGGTLSNSDIVFALRNIRITSYNVCYTKLLRLTCTFRQDPLYQHTR